MESFKCIMPDWREISGYAKKTAKMIKESDFHPEVIIGLSRGGLVPARLFCDFLHVKNCYSIKVDHWGLTATKDGKAKLSQALNVDVQGKDVLIVDDITDTGQSLQLAKKHIAEMNPKRLRTATLIHLNNSKYTPDFYGYERDWAWIIFPWNYTEDMVNLIKKITEKEEKTAEQIKEHLKDFDIDSEEAEIEDILTHINYLEKVDKDKEKK